MTVALSVWMAALVDLYRRLHARPPHGLDGVSRDAIVPQGFDPAPWAQSVAVDVAQVLLDGVLECEHVSPHLERAPPGSAAPARSEVRPTQPELQGS